MKKLETIRDFINKRSNAAWISFDFTIDGRGYTCCSVEDFILDYGRKSAYLLDNYYVQETKESYPSNSQGQTIWLTKLISKEDFNQAVGPVTFSYTRFCSIVDGLEQIEKIAKQYKDTDENWLRVYNLAGFTSDLVESDYD